MNTEHNCPNCNQFAVLQTQIGNKRFYLCHHCKTTYTHSKPQYAYMIGMSGYICEYNSIWDDVLFDTAKEASKALIEHIGKDELTKRGIYEILRYGICELNSDITTCDSEDMPSIYPTSNTSLWYAKVEAID